MKDFVFSGVITDKVGDVEEDMCDLVKGSFALANQVYYDYPEVRPGGIRFQLFLTRRGAWWR